MSRQGPGGMVALDTGRPVVFAPPIPMGCSMADAEVGIARFVASIGRCRHENAVPVALSTGEIVAWVCPDPDCGTQLPAGWRTEQEKSDG